MNEFDLTLARFLDGQADDADLAGALERTLAGGPDQAREAAELLDAALAQGLPAPLRTAMRRRIDAATGADAPASAVGGRRSPPGDSARRAGARHPTSGRAALAALLAVLLVMAVLGYRELTGRLAAREHALILRAATGAGADDLHVGLAATAALEDRARRHALLAEPALHDAVARRIRAGGTGAVREVREALAPFDLELAGELLGADAVHAAVLEVHAAALTTRFAPTEGRLDYAAARQAVDALERVYPADDAVRLLGEELEAARADARLALERAYARQLEAGRFTAAPDAGSLVRTVEALRQVAPDHPLLDDPERAEAMIAHAERALDGGDVEGALAVLSARHALAPADPLLEALSRRALQQAAGMAAVDEAETLRGRIAERRDALSTLDDYRAVAPDLARLARIAPGDPLVGDLRWQLEALLESEVEVALAGRRVGEAARALYQLGPLLRLSRLVRLRERVTSVAASLGTDPFAPLADRGERRTLRKEIEALMRRPTLAPDWNAHMAEVLGRHVALVGPRGPGVPALVRNLELLYADGAARALADGDAARAAALVATGRALTPGSSALARVERDLRSGAVGYDAEQAVHPGNP